MGTTPKDAMVRMTKNNTNAEIWTQVGYFSDTPRINVSMSPATAFVYDSLFEIVY